MSAFAEVLRSRNQDYGLAAARQGLDIGVWGVVELVGVRPGSEVLARILQQTLDQRLRSICHFPRPS